MTSLTDNAPFSLIPPAYYADLACERGRLYLNELLNLGDSGSTTGTSMSRDQERQRNADLAKQMWGNGVHVDIAETMFYI
jgi:eukaryotic translation initiation factor 2C